MLPTSAQDRRAKRRLRPAQLAGLAAVILAGCVLAWKLSSFERRIASYVARMDVLLERVRARAAHRGAGNIDLPVYYVNMDAHADRRARIEARLKEMGPPPSIVRVAGVNGAAHMANAQVHSGFGWDSAGELGCTLSHLAVARQLLRDGHAAALVLEDDAHLGLVPLWPLSARGLTNLLPPGWTTLRLYHGTGAEFEPELKHGAQAVLTPYDLSATVRSPGTVAYVLSREGASALLALTDHGRGVHRDRLRTRDGRADTVMYEFPGALPYIVWPRHIFPYNDLSHASSTIHATASKHHLWHVRVAASVLERATALWLTQRLSLTLSTQP